MDFVQEIQRATEGKLEGSSDIQIPKGLPKQFGWMAVLHELKQRYGCYFKFHYGDTVTNSLQQWHYDPEMKGIEPSVPDRIEVFRFDKNLGDVKIASIENRGNLDPDIRQSLALFSLAMGI